MNRTHAREAAVRLIYAQSVGDQDPDKLVEDYFEPEHLESLSGEAGVGAEAPDGASLEYIRRLVRITADHRNEAYEIIRSHSHGWRPERISATAMAVLRCAITEMTWLGDTDVTPAVAINEAVEIAKGYEEPETVAFINGVLGGYARALEAERAGSGIQA